MNFRSKPLRWWLSTPLYASRLVRFHIRSVRDIVKKHGHLKGTVWLDVGANRGQNTIKVARYCRGLTVYAFEPTPELAQWMRSKATSNFHVIEAAVAEVSGQVQFHFNEEDATSSLLEQHPLAPEHWPGGEIHEKAVADVRAVRLDEFLNKNGISHVNWLKVDAQGTDLRVVKSLGNRLKDVDRISMEVIVGEVPQYIGCDKKEDVLRFMNENGFRLVGTNPVAEGAAQDLEFVRISQSPCTG